MLLNVLERKFILFGQVFWPQDFHLLVVSIIALIVFVILFTINFGRLFCGWACPQTLFMEFIFRQIEYLIEGDYNKQKKLDKQELDFEKFWKKSLKHLVFFAIAFLIINTIVAYLIGGEKLGSLIKAGPMANFGIFSIMVLFSAALYGIYAFFREQVCIIVCPYGRLQGVLLDEKSNVVAYDYKRGEPRGAFRASENRSQTDKGDCIDCNSCVQVCPTGIDIRNGTQLECVNCAACIDACNTVMDRVKLPRGLIRYDSEKAISTGKRDFFNGRSLAYSGFLALLLILVTTLFILRGEVEATILRVPGSMYQQYTPASYSNLFNIQLVNKTGEDMPIHLQLLSHSGEIIFLSKELEAKKGEVTEATFMVVIDTDELTASNTPLVIGVFSGDKEIDKFRTNFIGPNALDRP